MILLRPSDDRSASRRSPARGRRRLAVLDPRGADPHPASLVVGERVRPVERVGRDLDRGATSKPRRIAAVSAWPPIPSPKKGGKQAEVGDRDRRGARRARSSPRARGRRAPPWSRLVRPSAPIAHRSTPSDRSSPSRRRRSRSTSGSATRPRSAPARRGACGGFSGGRSAPGSSISRIVSDHLDAVGAHHPSADQRAHASAAASSAGPSASPARRRPSRAPRARRPACP